MRAYEFIEAALSKVSKTPDEQRIQSLTANKERADKALKQERQRQKLQKAQQTISKISMTVL